LTGSVFAGSLSTEVREKCDGKRERAFATGVGEVYSAERRSGIAKLLPFIQHTVPIHSRRRKSMSISSSVRVIRILVLVVLVLVAPSWAQNRPPISEEIAKAYGLDSWGQIEQIRYTFNLDIPGIKLSRTWTWEPKTGRVSYEGTDKAGKPVKVSYLRSELNSQEVVVKDEIEPGFVNDQYWLIFPFHQYWDSGAKVEAAGMQKLPLGKGSAEQVVVKYPAEAGGYTPGDTWTLFVGPDKRVKEFIYHRGGSKKPSVVVTTWAGNKMAGPLLVSTDHRGTADGKPAHIFFSDVAVKLTGSNTWLNAQ
jgi:hypothetical protein